MEQDYTVKVLTDYTRLDEIYRLTHDSLVEAAYISPQQDGRVIMSPHLDQIPETSIIATEKDGRIIATMSVTLDNSHGFPTDSYFEEETAAICAMPGESVGVIWRIATEKQQRGNSRLVLDTMFRGLQVMVESSCSLVLFTLAEKHIRVYQRLFEAKIIARKITTIDKSVEIPMVLMQAGVQRGWNVFNSNAKR
jgi:hypothetical protein